jgi:hypothetical protein
MEEQDLSFEDHISIFINNWFYDFPKKMIVEPVTNVGMFFTNIDNIIIDNANEAFVAIDKFVNKIIESISTLGEKFYEVFIKNPYDKLKSFLTWLINLLSHIKEYLFELSIFFTSKFFSWFTEILFSLIVISIKIVGDIAGTLLENVLNIIPNDVNSIIDKFTSTDSLISGFSPLPGFTSQLPNFTQTEYSKVQDVAKNIKVEIGKLFAMPSNLISVDELIKALKN